MASLQVKGKMTILEQENDKHITPDSAVRHSTNMPGYTIATTNRTNPSVPVVFSICGYCVCACVCVCERERECVCVMMGFLNWK